MPETTALGAAMAAGHAVGVWSLAPGDLTTITTDVFSPTITEESECYSAYIHRCKGKKQLMFFTLMQI